MNKHLPLELALASSHIPVSPALSVFLSVYQSMVVLGVRFNVSCTSTLRLPLTRVRDGFAGLDFLFRQHWHIVGYARVRQTIWRLDRCLHPCI